MATSTVTKKKAANKNEKPATSAPKQAPLSKITSPSFKFEIAGDKESVKKSILNHLKFSLARVPTTATKGEWWMAVALAVRDRVMERFISTMGEHHEKNVRRVYYLSLEYLMGRLLRNNLVNTGLDSVVRDALKDFDLDLEALVDEEFDMGLGNGGLGRLAACFLDSLATLDLPAVGYGIFYEFGLFRQEFRYGQQYERPDNWLKVPNPWVVARPENCLDVKLYGRVEMQLNDRGDFSPHWIETRNVMGVPNDIAIAGYGCHTVNFLRLWEARASEELDFSVFNEGGYVEAVREKALTETITKVLYPNDSSESGKELRLVQQYFFVACSLKDLVRRYKASNRGWAAFPEKVAIQLNDTHPAVAVAELMRILIDEEFLTWDDAWSLCRRAFSYTNHTLLPEALEKWSVPLFEKVLPRHLQIIYEINRRFLHEEVESRWPGDGEKKAALSLIEEGEPKMIRMAFLSVVASHTVNGVAALHTQLLKKDLMPLFNELYPGKFQNKTNGITPRRWLKSCNPRLAQFYDENVGQEWPYDLDLLKKAEPMAEDPVAQNDFMAIKRANKEDLAQVIAASIGVEVSPDALFDVQIKRLHEYKRQHLNLLHILTLYRRLLHNPELDVPARVFLFAAKAAPGYYLAKKIIHAINAVGATINQDRRIKDKIKVAFLPNYGVTLAERIIPAADLSEQISTAGKEASGTGNMKLSLNGALTIGTLDGANVEIQEEVGKENIFIFGHTVDQVAELRQRGYSPWELYNGNEELRQVVDWIRSGHFTDGDTEALAPVVHSLLDQGDPFLVLADYRAYIEAQDRVGKVFQDRAKWAKMAMLNSMRMGKFSSDRTITEYASEIWNLTPVHPST